MTRSYKLVMIESAVPGMVLSDNLLDRHGKVLLPEGTALTDKMLESLKRHDMEMIPVFVEALTEEEREMRRQVRQARLERLFRKRDYDDSEEKANSVLLEYLQRFRQGGEL